MAHTSEPDPHVLDQPWRIWASVAIFGIVLSGIVLGVVIIPVVQGRSDGIDAYTAICRALGMRYLSHLDTADRQEPTEPLAAKVTRLTEKLTKLKEEMGKLAVYEKQMLASPDQQISLTDPDSRSMATSGRGSGVVGYNVQVAVDTEHHLIVTHEVTNCGSDRAQLANMGK